MVDKLNELIGKNIQIVGEDDVILFEGKLNAFEYGVEEKAMYVQSNETTLVKIGLDDIKEITEI